MKDVYVIVFFIGGVPLVAAEGAWAIAYVLFIAYVSLEVPLWIAGLLTVALTAGHFVTAILFCDLFRYLQMSQLIANGVLWTVISVCGFWIHRRAEGACRKAFLDTRQSIQARLNAHDENDKLGRWIFLCVPLYMYVPL
jgi:hypothetical protein